MERFADSDSRNMSSDENESEMSLCPDNESQTTSPTGKGTPLRGTRSAAHHRCHSVSEGGLRSRISFRKKSWDANDARHNSLFSSSDFPPLPKPHGSNLSLFEGIKNESEAAIAAGMEFLSEASDKAQKAIQKVVNEVWNLTHFSHLPDWLKDNDYLHAGHRPQIESFKECFKSIFRIHTETGNIWTHLIGCVVFLVLAVYFLVWGNFPAVEKWVFTAFFAGAVLCLGFSFLFHTVYCHSQKVGLFFSKLDYCGIALLTLGSFVPWLHFGFYCKSAEKIVYTIVISVLAITAIAVSLWDKFSTPKYRALRAGVFVALGLSGLIPALHYVISEGWVKSVREGSLLWLFFMGFLYVLGAALYALRVPERFFPGRFDIWFQSHQIFHVLVVAAAFVHYYGISLMASHRFGILGISCPAS